MYKIIMVRALNGEAAGKNWLLMKISLQQSCENMVGDKPVPRHSGPNRKDRSSTEIKINDRSVYNNDESQ
jgi:hypothetical protein